MLHRRLLEHGNGLRARAIGTQRPGIMDRRFGIARISAVAFDPRGRGAPPPGGATPCGAGVSGGCVVLQPESASASAPASTIGAKHSTSANALEQIERVITAPVGPPDGFRQ